MPPSEAYVWQRVWTPEVAAAVQSGADFITRWHVLVAQGNAQSGFRRFSPDWTALARSLRPVVPVIRIDGQLDPATSSRLARNIAALFLDTPAPRQDRIEIDHDCATARLAAYTDFLTTLRARLPPSTAIDITALPTWLSSPALPALISASDRIILQVHGIDDPQESLLQPKQALAWVGGLQRISPHPFIVSLPAYGVRVIRGANGELQAAAAERINPDPRPGDEIDVPPASVAQLMRTLRVAGPGFSGIVWFRLPMPSDLRAWSSATLRHIAEGKAPVERLTVTTRQTGSAAQDVGLTNDGDDIELPKRIRLAPGCAGDAIGYYESSGSAFIRIRNGLLRSGRRIFIGWQRCAATALNTPEISVP